MRKHRKNTLYSGKARAWLHWDLQQFRRERGLTRAEFAQRLGISKSYLEILESFDANGLVPEPLPNGIAERLNGWQRALAGKVLEMPEVQCPLHDCALTQVRGFGWLRDEGKMKRWWAECVNRGEMYTVRADGLVQTRRNSTSAGRKPKQKSEKRSFLIGAEVESARRKIFERLFKVRRSLPKKTRTQKHSVKEELKTSGFSDKQIEVGCSARTPTIAARNSVAIERNLEFRTVAKYHREYLNSDSP